MKAKYVDAWRVGEPDRLNPWTNNLRSGGDRETGGTVIGTGFMPGDDEKTVLTGSIPDGMTAPDGSTGIPEGKTILSAIPVGNFTKNFAFLTTTPLWTAPAHPQHVPPHDAAGTHL
jgi:hypothetical protein